MLYYYMIDLYIEYHSRSFREDIKIKCNRERRRSKVFTGNDCITYLNIKRERNRYKCSREDHKKYQIY